MSLTLISTSLHDKSTDSFKFDRAQSNYSEKRFKGYLIQKNYGETRAQYLWRLLRACIRRTIDTVTKSDTEDKYVEHGIQLVRTIKPQASKIKSVCYDYHEKEIISLDNENYINFYRSDGRFISNFCGVDLNQDTSNRFVKFLIPNKTYDEVVYCSKDKQFVTWKKGEIEINIFSNDFELLSIAKSFEPIECLAYHKETGDIITISSNNELTVWNFRYSAKHLIPRSTYKGILSPKLKYNLIAIDSTQLPIVKCFIASAKNITVINSFDGTLMEIKDDLHIRQITAIIFFESMRYLITASRDGSIKVWDENWFLKMVFVGHNASITCLAIHPLAPYIISSSQDKKLKIWSLDQQDVLDECTLDEVICQIITEKHNTRLITVASNLIKLWKINHIYEMFTYINKRIIDIKDVQYKLKPQRILAKRESGGFHLINPNNGAVLTSSILNSKTHIVDSVYSSGEDTAILYLDNGELIKVDTRSNPCKIVTTNKSFPNGPPGLVNNYKDDDDEYSYLNKTSPVYRALRTKSPKDLQDVKLKSFDRTIVFAGTSDGSVCTLRWDNLDIDFEIEMHNNREILQLVSNVKDDQLISCGADLVIKIWRVYPYFIDTLQIQRSIFCSYPPTNCCLLRDRICVAFNDLKTLTHTIVFFSRTTNERYDHRPDDDHLDEIISISSCDRMKLVASASLDCTIRIWNYDCKLIRCIRLKEKPYSLSFCSERADILVGIGNHLFKIYNKSYLPKSIIFKMVAMKFSDVEHDDVVPISDDARRTLSPISFQRLKSAHQNEFYQGLNMNKLKNTSQKLIELENEENEIFDQEQKERNEGIAKLVERDLELKKLYNGEIKRRERKLKKKKITKEALEKYMQLYFNINRIYSIKDVDYFHIGEDDLFPKPIKYEKFEQFNSIAINDKGCFFPPLSKAQTKRPFNLLVEEYRNKILDSKRKLRKDNVVLDLPPDIRDTVVNIESPKPPTPPYVSQTPTSAKIEPIIFKSQVEETPVKPLKVDAMTQTEANDKSNEQLTPKKIPLTNAQSLSKNSKTRKGTQTSNKIENSPEVTPRKNNLNAKKRKSKLIEDKGGLISPILESLEGEEEGSETPFSNESLSSSVDYRFQSTLRLPVESQLTNIEDGLVQKKTQELESNINLGPYFIPGGFIPNSILIRILWPKNEIAQFEAKNEWKPKQLSDEQLKEFEQKKVKIDELDDDTEPLKTQHKKSIEDDDDDEDEKPKGKKQLEKKSDFMSKLTEIATKKLTPPPTPPLVLDEPEDAVEVKKFKSKDIEKEKEKIERIKEDLRQKLKAREENEQREQEEKQQQQAEEGVNKEQNEIKGLEAEDNEEGKRTFLTDLIDVEPTKHHEPEEQIEVAKPQIPEYVKQFLEKNWFIKYFSHLTPEQFPLTLDLFLIDIIKKCAEIFSFDSDIQNDISEMLDQIVALNIRSKRTIDTVQKSLIDFVQKCNFNIKVQLERDFLNKCLKLMSQLNSLLTKHVLIELIYWYLEGNEGVRRIIREILEINSISEYSSYFYEELDTWETWKIPDNEKKRQIKRQTQEWLNKWMSSFQSHIRDTYSRMKKGRFLSRISSNSKSILKPNSSLNDRATGDITLKFDLQNEKQAIEQATYMEAINYFCELKNDMDKLKIIRKDMGSSSNDKNTVLVIPKLNMNSILIRLGETNTQMTRPKRHSDNTIILPPIRLPSKYKYGDIYTPNHINLPMKLCSPLPFRTSIETINHNDNKESNEFYLTSSFDLLTLKTSNKYFIPHLTYNNQS